MEPEYGQITMTTGAAEQHTVHVCTEMHRERWRSSASVPLRAPQGEKKDPLGDVCDCVLC